MITVKEVEPDESILSALIACSVDWEQENSCHGYRRNTVDDILGNRIFIAADHDEIIGYLFGHAERTKEKTSLYEKDELFFELEELYVKPEFRSKGIGKTLFQYAETSIKPEIGLILLGTATKNYRAILHFYLDELDMEFWSARLFKRI